jgi:predicted RNase H-like nuclease (RuvC/YqgF family)
MAESPPEKSISDNYSEIPLPENFAAPSQDDLLSQASRISQELNLSDLTGKTVEDLLKGERKTSSNKYRSSSVGRKVGKEKRPPAEAPRYDSSSDAMLTDLSNSVKALRASVDELSKKQDALSSDLNQLRITVDTSAGVSNSTKKSLSSIREEVTTLHSAVETLTSTIPEGISGRESVQLALQTVKRRSEEQRTLLGEDPLRNVPAIPRTIPTAKKTNLRRIG